MIIERVFTPGLAQVAYLVGDESSGKMAVIDPRRDVDEYVRIALVENEQRIRQAARNLRKFLATLDRTLADMERNWITRLLPSTTTSACPRDRARR